MLEGGAGGTCRRSRRECVRNIVAPAHLQFDSGATRRPGQRETGDEAVRADRRANVRRAKVGRRPDAESHHACGSHLPPQPREFVVSIDHRRRVFGQSFDHFTFGSRNACQASESFEVLGARVRDQADRRTRDAHQSGNLSSAVRTHLDDGKSIRRLDPQQGERNPDMVVQIAAGRKATARL